MRTFEMLIVFAALMAMIAVVGIAIDWVGKPLRGRRFIPRVYRFDDELANSARQQAASRSAAQAPRGPVFTPLPSTPSLPPAADLTIDAKAPSWKPGATVAQGVPAAPVAVNAAADHAQPGDSVWTQLVEAEQADPNSLAARGRQAPVTPDVWTPGMALDQHIGGRRPAPEVKAERFWKAAAVSPSAVHFGQANKDRLSAGKAPRRRNPRTGKSESLQLMGLREASDERSVRMFWPDEAVDPWSSR